MLLTKRSSSSWSFVNLRTTDLVQSIGLNGYRITRVTMSNKIYVCHNSSGSLYTETMHGSL